MAKIVCCIKDLTVGDRIVTSVGAGTITSITPVTFLETSGPERAFEVNWEVNGETGHYLGSGGDKIELFEAS